MSRGFFRLWLMLSVWWIGFVVCVSIGDARPDSIEHEVHAALIPPGAFLAVGIMLGWVFAGFRRYPRRARLF
jgi:hypothetical protein